MLETTILKRIQIVKKGKVTSVLEVEVTTDAKNIVIISPRGPAYHKVMDRPVRRFSFMGRGEYLITDKVEARAVIVDD